MKKIYLVLFAAFLTLQLHAQWVSYSIPAVTNLFRSVYFLNADTGFVVGESAYPNPSPILKTTDGGLTSINYNSGTQLALRAVHFIDTDTGFVAGFEGKLLKSTDAGITWINQPSGTTQNLRSIDFPSHNIGYICGGAGTVLKTTDAGFTWNSMNVSTDTDLINIRFADDNTGYIAASDGSFGNGAIYKTTDGGASWSLVYSDVLTGFLGLAVVDASTIYAGGKDDKIIKSTDGGATWSQVYSGLSAHNIRSAFALDANTVWMGCDLGDIFYTNDGGTTWTNQSVNTSGIFGIHFPTPEIGYAVGSVGELLKYSPCALGAVSFLAGDTAVCEGDSVMYSINPIAGADSFLWTVPSGSVISGGNGTNSIIVIFGSVSGDISVSASNSCDTISGSFAVMVNPAPAIPTISFVNNILSSTSASTYQWYLNGVVIPGATSQDYTPMQNGFYSVVVTNAAGCEASSAVFDVIGLVVNEIFTNGPAFGITPNPLVTTSVVLLDKNTAAEFLTITNVQGRIIREISLAGNHPVTLDRKDFAEGMYFISVLNAGHDLIARNKLIVQ